MSPQPSHDPRGFITPDAFEVSPALLGMPLAAPSRRFAALLIDFVVIGFLTVVTKSFALVLGVVAAVFFIRVSFKRTDVRGSVFGRAMRFSLGCLGVFIGLTTALLWAAVGFDGFGGGDDPPAFVTVDEEGGAALDLSSLGGLGALAEGLGELRALQRAGDADEAREAATALARLGIAAGLDRDEIVDGLVDAVPADADWLDDAPDILADAVARAEAELRPDAEEAPPEPAAPSVDVDDLTTAEALTTYGDLLVAGPADPSDDALLEALRLRLLDEIAGDTMDALQGRVDDLEETADDRLRSVRALQGALADEREGRGLFAALRDFVDELGFGFGWASLYLTVVLSWWKGQTVGKKVMGVRVLRLDGEPITWWVAFERAGGYAAGFATGLLGFAQVYWDANRQAIHDRIVGTVVVREGAEKAVDWEEAL